MMEIRAMEPSQKFKNHKDSFFSFRNWWRRETVLSKDWRLLSPTTIFGISYFLDSKAGMTGSGISFRFPNPNVCDLGDEKISFSPKPKPKPKLSFRCWWSRSSMQKTQIQFSFSTSLGMEVACGPSLHFSLDSAWWDPRMNDKWWVWLLVTRSRTLEGNIVKKAEEHDTLTYLN